MQNELLQDQVDSLKGRVGKLQSDLLDKELTIEFLRKELEEMREMARIDLKGIEE